MNPENLKILTKWKKNDKKAGKVIRKTLNFVLMLVIRFLTNKKGKKYFFPHFFILLKRNTNDAHMQNFIQIPQKMKTGVQNVFKLVKDTLPFKRKID